MILALFTAGTVSAVQLPETAYGHIAESRDEAVEKNTEAIVRTYFEDIPIMAEIARCESTFRHELEDGSVLRGRVDPADTGVMQINKRYHEATATAMSLDLDDIHQNMEYARYLYDTQGTQPWSASMPCWGNLAANI
ncbi:hypothetical protein H6781_01155 [Candidatus Nomurabacteria bacterium]|nr:hypothetical protein [Candidatus Nomurabacteria bacterium]MCB9818236.1 hypothetical protein [Candidatus Nomurabacteria bacterium]